MYYKKLDFFTFCSLLKNSYHANSWLVKIASNGRYIVAPTIYGQLFVFNMLTEQLTGIVKEHQGKKEEMINVPSWILIALLLDVEVRDVLFHPYRPLVFSSGDGKPCDRGE